MRKLVSLLMALVMLATLVAIPAMAESAQDPITVSVFCGDPRDQPTSDNKIFKKIEEEFGLKFEFEFLAGDLDETLGVKIAGQDYADLMDGGNSAEKLIAAGFLEDGQSFEARQYEDMASKRADEFATDARKD